jgi:DNA invertase Pin-like site-specific DNA recombinase
MNEYNFKGKRYIAMVRASHLSDELSTDAQLQLLHDRVGQKGMIHAGNNVLDGVTGSLPGKREDLEKLLERKKKTNDFDVLVLQRLDRLTRSGSGHGLWFEHECQRAGIHVLFVGDDIPEGKYANLIKVAKYEAAQEQAFSISQRSTQGSQFALEQGRNITSTHTPYGCWRLYLNSEGTPTHIIRDLRDGLQEKLHHQTHEVIDTYGKIGDGARGHYRKQKSEKVLLISGDKAETDIVQEIFHLHFMDGLGGKRIADVLNRRGVASSHGKQWSAHQVEVIYEQEAYTGRSVGNRSSAAIYHERQSKSPKTVNLDPQILATARSIPPRIRPREEWFIQDQPYMKDFLPNQVRKLAMAEHEKNWDRVGDPNRVKRSYSKHKASDYLLSGLLFAKQDGESLVGILCGRQGHRMRYYRHRRSMRGYMKGSVFNNMFRADTLENAVLQLVGDIIKDLPLLREQVLETIKQQSALMNHDGAELDELKKRREQVRKKTELIVSALDEETLADARIEIERLKAERQNLNQKIAAFEAAGQMKSINPSAMADMIIGQLKELPNNLKSMPIYALRQFLATFINKGIADMETKHVEFTLKLPAWAFTQNNADSAMRLVDTLRPSTDSETHPFFNVKLGFVDCRYVKLATNNSCYNCMRRKAA